MLFFFFTESSNFFLQVEYECVVVENKSSSSNEPACPTTEATGTPQPLETILPPPGPLVDGGSSFGTPAKDRKGNNKIDLADNEENGADNELLGFPDSPTGKPNDEISSIHSSQTQTQSQPFREHESLPEPVSSLESDQTLETLPRDSNFSMQSSMPLYEVFLPSH